jgi:hypothetical protein
MHLLFLDLFKLGLLLLQNANDDDNVFENKYRHELEESKLTLRSVQRGLVTNKGTERRYQLGAKDYELQRASSNTCGWFISVVTQL